MAAGDVLWAHSADGTRVAVHDLGGTGDVALAVHGAGLCGLIFRPLAEALGARLHLYAIDLRGHGRSGSPENGDLAWARFSEDVAAAAALVGGAPLGIGHSAGGNAALRAEAVAPGTFTALFCFEPVMRTPAMHDLAEEELRFAEQARRRKASFPSRAAARARYADRPPFDALAPAALDAYLEGGLLPGPDGSVELACRPEDEATIYLGGAESDLWALAPAIACPTTVAFGEHAGNTHGPRFARAAAARIPRARLVGLGGLGHFGPFEDPRRVAAEVITSFETARA